MLKKKMKKLAFSRRRFILLSIALVSLVTVMMLLSAWPGFFVRPLQAQSVGAKPVLGAVFSCTPTGVASFDTRVHVRCSAAAPGGILYFAVSTMDSGRASRYLSVFTTAKVTGKNLDIFYDANDLSGGAWGCNTNDCRNIFGAEVR